MSFHQVALPLGEAVVFAGLNWRIRPSEQWAIVGPNGSGKSLLVEALLERIRPAAGEIITQFRRADGALCDPQDAVGLVSAQAQREFQHRQTSYYQSRWHAGIDEGESTVAQHLSQEAVEQVNPYEIGRRSGNSRQFASQRRHWLDLLGARALWRRKLICLSHGEQRKVLLVHELLRQPQLLILDDPGAGLDAASQRGLRRLLAHLARSGLPMLLLAHHLDAIPGYVTHVLAVRDYQVAAQGPKAEVLGRLPSGWLPQRALAVPHSARVGRSARRAAPHLLQMDRVTIRARGKVILSGISWTIKRGEHWAIQGPNGSGKTTLLSVLQGDHPQAYACALSLFGRRLVSSADYWRARQRIGLVSPELHQHYPLEWTCLEVVGSGFAGTLGLFDPLSARQKQAARAWLEEVGMGPYAGTPLGALPLGWQRLVLLGRAMVRRPDLLLLDEPCQGLDDPHRHTLLAAVDRAIDETDAHLLFVTHQPREIPNCITHLLRLQRGRMYSAAPRNLSHQPRPSRKDGSV